MKRKYPTQEDCQMLVDIMNRPNIYYSACSQEFKAFGIKCEDKPKGWVKLFDKAFGTKSPWEVKVVFNKGGFAKRVLYWEKEKAKILGL